MTYNEKKSLYESIMKDVAKIVKRQINEAGVPNIEMTNYAPTISKDFDLIRKIINNTDDETKIKSFIRILNSLAGNEFYEIENISGERMFYISKLFSSLMNNNGTIEEMQSFMNKMSKTDKQVGSAIYR